MIHTVKGFGIVNKAEVNVFLEFSCFFSDSADTDNLISGSSAFSKFSLNIWKFTVHVLLMPGLENFEHYFTSVWDEYNCVVVWAFFGIHTYIHIYMCMYVWENFCFWDFWCPPPFFSSSFKQWNFTTGGAVVKNTPVMQETQETWVWSLGWEESLV